LGEIGGGIHNNDRLLETLRKTVAGLHREKKWGSSHFSNERILPQLITADKHHSHSCRARNTKKQLNRQDAKVD
jgi:hypothetical protein